MRKSLLASLLILAVFLSSCQPKAELSSKMVLPPSGDIFETTPTSSVEKGSDEDLAKAVPTATKHSSYPTPKSTYLVPSTLSTYTDPNIPTKTPTSKPATATATKTIAAATATTAPTSSGSQTSVPASPTLQATATSTVVKPTSTVAATGTAIPATATATQLSYTYAIQSGSPVLTQNFINASAGCSWQGIAGQVFSSAGAPQANIVVKAGGTWNGIAVSQLSLTGLIPGYGEGGYEITLGSTAVNSTGTVWVQIYDLAGNPISDKAYVNTSSDCTKNLVVLNFMQIAD